jgi:hypothetical protein
MVSKRKFVATQNTNMSGGPIVGEICVFCQRGFFGLFDTIMIPVRQRPMGNLLAPL